MPTYDKIATTTLGSNQAEITFSSITQSYTDLILRMELSKTAGGSTVYMRINGDTGGNYSSCLLIGGEGNSISSQKASNNSGGFGVAAWQGNTTGRYGIIVNFFNYTDTAKSKTMLHQGGSVNNSGGSGYKDIAIGCSTWHSTSAITSMTVRCNGGLSYTTGSIFTLYGILKA